MIKSMVPVFIKRSIKRIYNRFKKKGGTRYFCISMQRTGTTSVGDFFKQFNYPVAGWNEAFYNKWSQAWYDGDFESIFSSADFNTCQVFEDSPWWHPEFYKVLYHRFPEAKFILFIRNTDSWFDSMVKHSGGKTLGNTKRHCKIYRREEAFYDLKNHEETIGLNDNAIDNLLSLEGMGPHYKTIYETRNREIIDFFNEKAPDKLFVCNLEDPMKWQKLGAFANITVPDDFEIHSNRSAQSKKTSAS